MKVPTHLPICLARASQVAVRIRKVYQQREENKFMETLKKRYASWKKPAVANTKAAEPGPSNAPMSGVPLLT